MCCEIIENGSTYTLQFDPSQDFSGDYFHLSPDNNGAGPVRTSPRTPALLLSGHADPDRSAASSRSRDSRSAMRS